MSIPYRLIVSLLLLAAIATTARANDAAYVLLYQQVAHGTRESSSVTPEQFSVHMEYIADNGYRVVPLEKILTALKKGKKIAPRSLAITFDGAHPSVLHNALPVLEQHKFPFTVFVSTEEIDMASAESIGPGSTASMTWEQLRSLEKSRGSIASRGHKNQHMLTRAAGETDTQWRERISGDIRYSQSRLQAELKRPARLLAYPYGEFDTQLVELVGDMDYLAVGQQSGPIGRYSNALAAPRFMITLEYADLPRVSEKLNSRPFDVTDPLVPAQLLPPAEDQPTLDLHIKPGPYRAAYLTCFVTGQGTAKVRWQDASSTYAKITARDPLAAGHTDYTCTAPHESIPNIYYWYSYVFMRSDVEATAATSEVQPPQP